MMWLRKSSPVPVSPRNTPVVAPDDTPASHDVVLLARWTTYDVRAWLAPLHYPAEP